VAQNLGKFASVPSLSPTGKGQGAQQQLGDRPEGERRAREVHELFGAAPERTWLTEMDKNNNL
jgi:hypothetical protein